MDRLPWTLPTFGYRSCYMLTSLLVIFTVRITGGTAVEKCSFERFEASCTAGQMILINNASFGRMLMSRCVKQDFGYLGCAANVLPQVQRQCSGRQECNFPVAELQQEVVQGQGCPNDLASYLEVEYSCTQVVSCETSLCEQSDYLRLSPPGGFLSSEVTWQTSCGSATCPWLIETDPGQRINLTLYDFSLIDHRQPSKICWKYATVHEERAVTKDITVCSGDFVDRSVTHVFLSESNKISVTLHTPNDKTDLLYFALKYQVVGCPSIKAPANSVVKREDTIAFIQCEGSDLNWKLTCDGNAWVGQVGSCDSDEWANRHLAQGSEHETVGMLLIIGLGVAIGVVVGGLLLTLALVYLRRRNNAQAQARTETRLLDETGFYSEQNRYIGGDGKSSMQMSIKQYKMAPPAHEHNYTCTLPMRPQHHVALTCDGHVKNDVRYAPAHEEDDDIFPPPPDFIARDHIYETPRFPLQDMPRRGVTTQSADGICRKIDCDEGRSNRTS